MNTWHVGEKCEVTESPGEDGSTIMLSEYYLGTKNGYTENIICMKFNNDGLSFSDKNINDGFVFLYPKQIEHRRRLLEVKP